MERITTPAPVARRKKSRALKVLIVDDHELMLRSLVRMLAGCDTVVTTSPAQALSVLQSGGHFDAIVSDVMMPGLSGPELYKQCFRESPELAQRFIFASAEPFTARHLIDEAAAEVGAVQAPVLLAKPTSRALLMSAVANVALGSPHESGTYFVQFASNVESESDGATGRPEAIRGPAQRSPRSSGNTR